MVGVGAAACGDWLMPDRCCPQQGPARKIFVEFLERSCTAEFSGFLLYKELGRRLKKTNPVVAEVGIHPSRDSSQEATTFTSILKCMRGWDDPEGGKPMVGEVRRSCHA